MSTQSSTPSVTGSQLEKLQQATLTVVGYVNSFVKWFLVVNIVGLAGIYWVNLIRINLALNQQNKAAVALASLIVAVFAVIGWLHGVGVFDDVRSAIDRFSSGQSTPN